MKQAIINPDLSVTLEHGAAIPTPKDFEIIIKAETAAINPVDWKASQRKSTSDHKADGKDFAGVVHSIGSKVFQFKPGDRVAALNHVSGFAEYSIGPAFSTFKLPDHVSFDDAVAYGLPYFTASLGLFKNMPLPAPWSPARPTDLNPLLIYGASSAVGAFAVKLAASANIHPIIAVAGAAAKETIGNILSPEYGDTLIDYRNYDTPEALVGAIKAASPHLPGVKYIFDVICTEETINHVAARVADPAGSYLACAVASKFAFRLPAAVAVSQVFAPALFQPSDTDGAKGPNGPNNVGSRAHASVAAGYLEFALGEGLLAPHIFKVLPNGLSSLQDGLLDLKHSRNKSLRYVMRVGETRW